MNGIINEDDEDEKQKTFRLMSVYFAQLLHISSNMIDFNLNKNDVKKFIIEYSEQYNLTDDYKNELDNIIESQYKEKSNLI
jgi:hypothetical protein